MEHIRTAFDLTFRWMGIWLAMNLITAAISAVDHRIRRRVDRKGPHRLLMVATAGDPMDAGTPTRDGAIDTSDDEAIPQGPPSGDLPDEEGGSDEHL